MDSYQGCYKIVLSPTPSSHEAKRQWRKSTALLAVICSTIVLVAVIYVGVQLKNTHDGKNVRDSIRSLDLIENVCNATLYYDLCISSLSSCPGSLEANMSELARIAVEVSLDEAIRVTNFVVELNKSADDQSREAFEDCAGLLDNTVDQLNSSVSVLAEQDWKQGMDDLKTWLSAALTNPSTCVEDFEDAIVIMDESMKQKIENLIELVSNDLAILNFVCVSEENSLRCSDRFVIHNHNKVPEYGVFSYGCRCFVRGTYNWASTIFTVNEFRNSQANFFSNFSKQDCHLLKSMKKRQRVIIRRFCIIVYVYLFLYCLSRIMKNQS